MSAPTILLAAPASGSGKTVLTMALLRAFRRRGLTVGSFKVGPDYIDPAFLTAAAGRPAPNLDSWAMRFETVAGLLEDSAAGVDLLVGEGVMGLFDGAPDGSGSTADLAALFGIPVLLVVDARGMGQSVSALVDGFRRHREDVDVVGVILNRTSGPRHADLLRRALTEQVSTPVIGAVDGNTELGLPSRHLGLVQAIEHPDLERVLETAADIVESSLDLDRIVRLARMPSVALLGPQARPLPPLGQRIAVAKDAAFAFAYAATLSGWRRQGAEILPFSPLADAPPDPSADAVFLPGGYPELHASTLAAAGNFLAGLRAAAERSAAIYGECGGYMVLGRRLVDREGVSHEMAGLLPVATSYAAPKLRLGYRLLTTLEGSFLGTKGAQFRGHEFHVCAEIENDGPAFVQARSAMGEELGRQGCRKGSVAGSFHHLIDRAERQRS
ncbi:MAG: cobyrinate a,c-diamide synthase [Geminicoccaceae bacterium]